MKKTKVFDPHNRRRGAAARRATFEARLAAYCCDLHNAGRMGHEQPPYMAELRALYMAVRATYKPYFSHKGMTVDHMWPREAGRPRKGRQAFARAA